MAYTWEKVPGFNFTDLLYEKRPGVAKITINRPEAFNAFTSHTGKELAEAFEDAGGDDHVGVVVITGAGKKAFCTGGDAKEAEAGYSSEMLKHTPKVHALIREMPKPVIAAVNGFAIGGGQVLQQICDLSIASETAQLGQAGPMVGSYDAAFGAAYLTRVVGEKKAREIWYLCRRYTAREALEMGLVNAVVPPDKLEEEVDKWCDEILAKSPGAIKGLKAAFNLMSAEIRGLEILSFDGLWRYYATEEAKYYKQSFWEKKKTDPLKYRKKEMFPGIYEE
ncbi:MAG: 1,4-dihydroxy-2-naphthoyl-CoA synthase [Syntrophaceae bacterium CG2_30_49_12]|nr:MAG: 1,4-dihydroxy-2-naphthoyl-CoA synthase [Syntrophaceae bacterium CG2_30_49_12]PJA48487.1 MAG: 1,4-dihydroxy-2-naphthoyl-CoA synthase [Syntrophobacterales bacterium CG_4_9_14_3_um_filter_49_8]